MLQAVSSSAITHREAPAWIAAFVASAALLGGCSRHGASGASGADEPVALGAYRAVLALPGGELPFGLDIAREKEHYVAYLVNGAERVRVPEVQVQGDRIEMRMPGFENRLSAQIDGDKLTGEAVIVKSGGKQQVIPFVARHGPTYRFVETPAATRTDVSGRWAVTFTEPDTGKQYPAVGEFHQNGTEVTGTFLTPTGDHRYLAGDVRDNELLLSTFDGAHAFLYHAKINSKAQIEGTYWSGLAWHEQFLGHRDDAATLGNSETATALRAEAGELAFTFPDPDGKPVSLADARFTGKVVIIALGGSWCPNCHDEAAFLAPYYVQNRKRGLEVVELMFEQFGDFPHAADATRRFRDAFGVQYTTLIAGISDKEDAAKRLPQLNGVYAFPTTLFLDRHGRVRRIYTGFSGPGTGDHYQKLIEDFDATVEQLLAETDGPPLAGQRPEA
jgi:thiol-disulfide isomerase/thioredoxin